MLQCALNLQNLVLHSLLKSGYDVALFGCFCSSEKVIVVKFFVLQQ